MRLRFQYCSVMLEFSCFGINTTISHWWRPYTNKAAFLEIFQHVWSIAVKSSSSNYVIITKGIVWNDLMMFSAGTADLTKCSTRYLFEFHALPKALVIVDIPMLSLMINPRSTFTKHTPSHIYHHCSCGCCDNDDAGMMLKWRKMRTWVAVNTPGGKSWFYMGWMNAW